MKFRQKLKKIPGFLNTVRLLKSGISVILGCRVRFYSRQSIRNRVVELSGYKNIFVGYYDHCPFNSNDESLLLIHGTNRTAWQKPSPKVHVSILLIDWQTGRLVRELGQSYSWNWQQGARSIWYDRNSIIFNVYDSKNDAYRAQILSIEGKDLQLLPIPVQEIDGKGRIYAISYEALYKVRPDYGYRNRQPSKYDLAGNAIELFEVQSGNHLNLVNVLSLQEDAFKRHGKELMLPKINHLLASPNGNTLMFLFRYYVNNSRVTDLYALDTETHSWRCIIADSGASHACWLDNTYLLVTMNGIEGFGYYRVKMVAPHNIQLIRLHSDGHPSPINESFFLSDSYPDKFGLRSLLAIPYSQNQEVVNIESFPEPLLFQGETRCDLHPSLSPSGRFIQVDCAIGHRRHVAVIPNSLFKDAN